METEEFKNYQRRLNQIRVNALREGPLPTKRPLLEPDVTFKVNISDLSLPNIEINPSALPEIEDKPVKSNSKSLF